MRAVLINHCHPDMAHVCGLRAGRFADAMAARGHEIVVLTQALPEQPSTCLPSDLSAVLAKHDWRRPFALSAMPAGYDWARRARTGDMVTGLRQLAIARSYLTRGGMFPDWQAGIMPYLGALATAFQPDVVWGTFGNTDTWKLCRRLAKLAGCPWVGDFKDNWSAFVPLGFQTLMAGRFADMVQMTVLSMAHCDQADRFFPRTMKAILYSGIDEIAERPPTPTPDPGAVELLLTGSVYDAAILHRLAAALGAWAAAHPDRATTLRYAGNDGGRVEAAAAKAGLVMQDMGFVSQDELHRLQAAATANVYIHNPRCLLHHKALELIAAGRPIVAFPGESEEVKALAAEVGVALFACDDGEQAGEALDMICANPPPIPSAEARRAFTWESRAAVLETVLTNAIAAGGRGR